MSNMIKLLNGNWETSGNFLVPPVGELHESRGIVIVLKYGEGVDSGGEGKV